MNPALSHTLKKSAGAGVHKRFAGLVETAFIWLGVSMMACGVGLGMTLAFVAPPAILPFAGFAAFSIAILAVTRVIAIDRKASNYEKGRHGERLVGEALETLRVDGAEIVHSLWMDGKKTGDIDHVLVHPAGVFAIETKMKSGSRGRPATVRIVHGKVQGLGQDPAAQARRAAACLAEALKEAGAYRGFVQPILVYPGAEIVEIGKSQTPVVRASGLIAHIRKSRRRLSADQVKAIACAIRELDNG